MQRQSWIRRAAGLGASLLLAAAFAVMAGSAAAQEMGQPVPLDDVHWARELLKSVGEAPPAKVSQFWLGIGTEPVTDGMRAQLKLPEGQGLLVFEVLPGSPAATAKLQKFDVLLKANDKPVAKIEDLMEALDASQGKKMNLEIVRAGKTMSVEVTPAKRPPEFTARSREPGMDAELRKLLEQTQPGRPLRFRWMQPGILLPPGAKMPSPMPADMTVTITKQGDKPAKVAVSQGDKKWETTEDDLDKLPADVRTHVERLLGHFTIGSGQAGTVDMVPDWNRGPGTEAQKQLDKHLDEMNRQIEQLRKSLDELKARQRQEPEAER